MKKIIIALSFVFALFAARPVKSQPGLLEIYAGTYLYDSYHSDPGDLGGYGGYDDDDDDYDANYDDNGDYDDSGDEYNSNDNSASDTVANAVYNVAMAVGNSLESFGDWADANTALVAYQAAMGAFQQAGNASGNDADFGKAYDAWARVRGKYEALGGK